MATKKITPLQKEIFQAYVAAKKSGTWDMECQYQGSKDQFIQWLRDKKTSKILWSEIESRFCTISQQLMGSTDFFDNPTYPYLQSMQKGFKTFLCDLGIE